MHDLIPKTLHPLLQTYADRLTAALGDVLIGSYLYNSITLGAYDPQKSDIDIVTVLSRRLTPAETDLLCEVHKALRREYRAGGTLDAMYIQRDDAGLGNEQMEPYPFHAGGKFHAFGYFDINSVTWWTLQHHGIPIAGQPVAELQLAVRWEQVVRTMAYNINTYWAKVAKQPFAFLREEDVEFAVLTLCRILYTLERREITAKTKAVAWALTVLPPRWELLLEEALRIRCHPRERSLYPSRLERRRDTRRFLQEISRRCNETHFSGV